MKKYENLTAGMNKGLLFWHPCLYMRFYRHWDLLPSSWPSSGDFPNYGYYVSVPARMTLACVLLLVTQAGVGLAMFQKRQGSVAAEGIALIHCLGIFVVLAMAEQTFYIGWDVTSYVIACAILCLPVVYFLCSVAALVVYDLSLLYWTASGGPLNTFGGTGPIVAAPPFGRAFL